MQPGVWPWPRGLSDHIHGTEPPNRSPGTGPQVFPAGGPIYTAPVQDALEVLRGAVCHHGVPGQGEPVVPGVAQRIAHAAADVYPASATIFLVALSW